MNLLAEQQTNSLKESLTSFYTTYGSLEGFFDYYLQVAPREPIPLQPGEPGQITPLRELRGVAGLIDNQYRALMPTFGVQVGEIVPAELINQTVAVEVDGRTIAYILPDPRSQFKLSAEEELFLRRTNLAIGLAALAGVLAAVGMGVILAGRLVKPIRRLTRASQSLARGEWDQQVPVTSKDELGQLTASFNQMSADLYHADQERKRLTADITHDLSTPLQIISGYIEMLEDGEVALTPQRIEIIKTEIEHLRRLVGDLTTLSQVETDSLDMLLEPVEPAALLEKIVQAYEPIAIKAGIDLVLIRGETTATIKVDEGRMLQVLKNLLENALRHTPGGGKITLSVEEREQVLIRVSDNGAGIDSEDLPFVFDRFYRSDKARGRDGGKMGLGLAICKALVTAMGGTITAESAGRGQGTTITIGFPPFINWSD
jgi:signal transduction histidine kinase